MRIYPLGERAAVLEFGTKPAIGISERIGKLHRFLRERPFPGYVESVPAYTTLTVYYDPVAVLERGIGPLDLPSESNEFDLKSETGQITETTYDCETGRTTETASGRPLDWTEAPHRGTTIGMGVGSEGEAAANPDSLSGTHAESRGTH